MADNFNFENAKVLWDDPNGISFAPEEQGPSGISMAAVQAPAVSESIANLRSEKYNYALGEDSPGKEVLKHSIQTGGEFFQRRLAATKEFARQQEVRNNVIRELATRNNGQVDDDTRNLILSMTSADMADPNTFFEKAYARKQIAAISLSDADRDVFAIDGTVIDTSTINESLAAGPEETNQIMDAAEVISAKNEVAIKLYEDYAEQWKNEGWNGKGISDTVEMLTPFMSWYRMSNLHEKNDSLMLGNNLEETYESLALITDVDEYKAAVEGIAANLYAKNGYDAIMFLQGLHSFNSSDKAFANLVSVVDTLTGLSSIKSFGKMVAGGLQKASTTAANQVLTVAGTGNIEKAGLGAATQILATRGAATNAPKNIGELMFQVQPIVNPNHWFGLDLGSMTTERASRVINIMENNASKFLKEAFDEPMIAGRIEPGSVAEQAVKEDVRDLMNATYGRGSDVVIEVNLLDPEQSTGGVQFASIKLGNVDATLYDTEAIARMHADEWYGIKGPYEVKEQGNKFYIEVLKPVSEDSTKVRKARESMSVETKWSTPKTWANLWIPWLRSKDSLTSLALREDSITGTMGKQQMTELARELFKPIGKVSRQEQTRLEKFLQTERDFEIKGNRGKFSEGYAEFERNWMKEFDQLPSDAETLAYMTARQLNDYQYMLTNMALYRDKSRKGMEYFGFGGLPTEIEGALRRHEDLWKHVEDAGILVYDFADKPVYARKRFMRQSKASEQAEGLTRDGLNEMLSSGNYKLIQISDVGEQKLREILGEAADGWGGIEFVISRDLTTGPLPFQQIPYKPGGHVGLEAGYFARVPNVRQTMLGGAKIHTYYGDKNLFHFQSLKEAEIFIPRLNHLRELYLKRDIAQMRALISNGYVPLSLKELARVWGGKKPKYDPNMPIYLTKMDESVEQAHKISGKYDNFTSKADSPYDMYKGSIALEWTGKRGGHTYTMINDGSWTNPSFKKDRAAYIDAIPMLERTTRSLLRDRYLGGIKHSVGEQFLAENMKVLDLAAMGGADAVRADPLRALNKAVFLSNADKRSVAAAKNMRRASLELLDMPSSALDEHLRYTQLKLVQDIYDTKGAKAAQTPATVARYALSAVTDFPAFARSFAFDWKIGLFNPVQLFLQGMTTMHTMGIAGPVNGMKGIEAAMLQRAAMFNPDHLERLSKMAPGWNPEHFKESFEMARRIGWYRVGKEYATIDDVIDPALGTSKVERVREFLRFFFKEGERFTRMTAWNAAYQEWRAANPKAIFNNLAGRQVLDRSNILSVQMTAASNASWQKGIIGIPTQFYAYHARLTEQFLSKTLTPAEKTRLFATYSAIYGVPVTMGAPVGVWEVGQTIQEYFQENDINTDANMFSKVLNDGLLSIGLEMGSGTKTSISQRIGPGGLPFLEDLLDGDTGVLEALGGVSGQTLFDGFLASEPLVGAIVGAITGQNSVFDIRSEDIWDILRTSSTGNTLHNLMQAIATGQYISKKGIVLDDGVNTTEAWMSALLGANPMRIDDAFKRLENTKERNKFYQDKSKQASKEFMRAWRTDDEDARVRHLKRAQAILDLNGIPREWRIRAFEDSRTANEPMIRNINRKWADTDPKKLQRLIDEANGRKGN